MLFERFGSISWTVSFFALEGVAGVAAALASSLVSERPRVSPDEGGNQGPDERGNHGPDEGGNQGLHVSHLMRGAIRDLMRVQSGRPRVSPSPNVASNCLASKSAWASSTTSFSSQIVSATCNDAWLSLVAIKDARVNCEWSSCVGNDAWASRGAVVGITWRCRGYQEGIGQCRRHQLR